MLRDPKQCQHVLANMENLVIKEVQDWAVTAC